MNFFKYRRAAKTVRELLKHAHHLRNMREDIMAAADIEALAADEANARAALKRRDIEAVEDAGKALSERLSGLTPRVSWASLRENLEIVVVAIAVAMACRTYFLQPFKIPTGSMQPTLYGITSEPKAKPGLMDRMPLKLAKWLATGQWYREIRAETSGPLEDSITGRRATPSYVVINHRRYKIPRDARLHFRPGQLVHAGDLLWSGVVTAGDHVFVDKVRWNFQRPRRGQIMVFSTDGIPTLPTGTHYIKRLAGLPGERISIDPPNLVVNGRRVVEPRSIARIVYGIGKYKGYELVDPRTRGGILRSPSDFIRLDSREFLALGDNTGNSRDGRYWGPVPAANMLGPAVLVYWPFSSRWGTAN